MDAPSFVTLQESRALEVLIQLLETPGILRTTLYERVMENGAGKPTLIKRVNELIAAGLIEVKKSETHKAGQYLFLSDSGREIAELAVQMKKVLLGESIGDETNYGASSPNLP